MTAPQLQPSRRAVVLVYFGCVAVPFAVATLAYLFRAGLADAPLHPSLHHTSVGSKANQATASKVSTMTLVPSANAAEIPNHNNASTLPNGK